MHVLVVGGTGFIGRCVVRQLVDAGCEVTVVHRGRTSAPLPPPPVVSEVLADRAKLAGVLGSLPRPVDAVVDTLLLVEADAAALLQALRGKVPRLVVLSSGDVYRNYDGLRGLDEEPNDPRPLTEAAPLRTRLYPYRDRAPGADDWSYHYDKLLIERVVLAATQPAGTVLRLPMVYGPFDAQRRLLPYLQRMEAKRPAILLEAGQSAWRVSRGYVEDVAAAVALAARDPRAAGQTYNVGEPEPLSERRWVETIGDLVGWRGPVVEAPPGEMPGSLGLDWRYHLALDTGKIRRELGFEERVGRLEGLRRTIEWDRANPPASGPVVDYAREDAWLRRAGVFK